MCSTSILGLKPSKPIIYTNSDNNFFLEFSQSFVLITCYKIKEIERQDKEM